MMLIAVCQATSNALKAAGPGVYESVMFSPQGPAGAFALYVAKDSNLSRVFLNECVCVSPNGPRIYMGSITPCTGLFHRFGYRRRPRPHELLHASFRRSRYGCRSIVSDYHVYDTMTLIL
jgi:hypothetical protein